jgi:hypothetical protein
MQINSCTLGQNKFFRGCRSTGGSGVPKQISFKVGSHICKHVGICYTGHNIPKLNKKKHIILKDLIVCKTYQGDR